MREPGDLSGGITRDVLERDGIRDAFAHRHPNVALNSDADMRRSITDTLAQRADAGDDRIWLFGYGSLLWNPCVFSDMEPRAYPIMPPMGPNIAQPSPPQSQLVQLAISLQFPSEGPLFPHCFPN